MVKLGIISDSHGSTFWTERFLDVARREKFDAVFHLGDGESEARWLERRLDVPVTFVAGNCDLFSRTAREAWANYEGHRLIATHGHLHDVKYGLDRLSYYAEEHGADIALYGHTHEAQANYVGPVLMINPGALMRGHFCELTLDGRHIIPKLMEL